MDQTRAPLQIGSYLLIIKDHSEAALENVGGCDFDEDVAEAYAHSTWMHQGCKMDLKLGQLTGQSKAWTRT